MAHATLPKNPPPEKPRSAAGCPARWQCRRRPPGGRRVGPGCRQHRAEGKRRHPRARSRHRHRLGIARPGRHGVSSGTLSFRPDRFEGGGMRYLRFKHWLTEIKSTAGGIDAVYFEEVRRHAGTSAAQIYGGFLAHVAAWCEHHGIPLPGRAGRHHQAPRHRQGQRAEGCRHRGGARSWLRACRRQRGRRHRAAAVGDRGRGGGAVMPISSKNMRCYPGGSIRSPEWLAIRCAILNRAQHHCEGAPAHYPECRAANGERHPETGSKVVLTIAHLDQDPANNEPTNLRALCQRCHNAHDAPWRRQNARATRRRRKASSDLFDGPFDTGAR